MSSTRKAKPGKPLRQERYASSAALQSGLLGNLVAKRCETVRDPELRRLIYSLQEISWRDVNLPHPACPQFPAWPWESTGASSETPFEIIARELGQSYGLTQKTVKQIPGFLARLCLDPKIDVAAASLPGFTNIISALQIYREQFCQSIRSHVAATEPACIVWDALNYALALGRGSIVLVEGNYRIGKSFSAQAWAQQHIGEARYIQLTSSRDDGCFFRDIARCLGVSASTKIKAAEIRAKIEPTLRTRHMLLILDEAQNIWPKALRPKCTPERAEWLMTALVNAGVSIALIGPPDFSRLMLNVQRNVPIFGMEQFLGRVRLRKTLPDTLGRADLESIARLLLPSADVPTVLLLVGHALTCKSPAATLETTASRVKYFAGMKSRSVTFEDAEKAIAENPATGAKDAFGRGPAGGSPRTRGAGAQSARTGDKTFVPGGRSKSSLSALATFPGMFAGTRGE